MSQAMVGIVLGRGSHRSLADHTGALGDRHPDPAARGRLQDPVAALAEASQHLAEEPEV
jgi:hypothetical protein